MSAIFRLAHGSPITSAGLLAPGAKVYIYLTTTSTLASVWTDQALSVPGANPIVADAAGVLPIRWLDDSLVYKVVVNTAADALITSDDPATDGLPSAATIGSILYPRTSAEIAAGVTPTAYQYPELNVKRYGALGDDANDDTAAIANAFLVAIAVGRGELFWPKGTYRHTALTLAPSSSTISVNLKGEGGSGATGTILKYTGSGGAALTIKNNTRYRARDLALVNAGSGSPEGLVLKSLAAGSNSGPAVWENIRINAFTTDCHLGDSSDDAVSEHTFINFEVGSATTGILIEGSSAAINTLNVNFFGLFGASNTTGLKYTGPTASSGANVNVHGGSFSNNTTDFDLQTPGRLYVNGMFIDSGGRLVNVGPGTASSGTTIEAFVEFDSVFTNYAAATGGIVVKINHAGRYTFRNCALNNSGAIQMDGAASSLISLTVEQSTINTAAPITYTGNRALCSVRIYDVGTDLGTPTLKIDDRDYIIDTAGREWDLRRFKRSLGAAIGAAGVYTAADTTPSVVGMTADNVMIVANSGATSITTFDDGYDGQVINLKFSDANTTLVNGASLKLSGAANFTSTSNDTMSLVRASSVWYETSRSVN